MPGPGVVVARWKRSTCPKRASLGIPKTGALTLTDRDWTPQAAMRTPVVGPGLSGPLGLRDRVEPNDI